MHRQDIGFPSCLLIIKYDTMNATLMKRVARIRQKRQVLDDFL